MNPGDLVQEYSGMPDVFPTFNKTGIILRRFGEFPNYLYEVLSENGSIKLYRTGSIRRLRMHAVRRHCPDQGK